MPNDIFEQDRWDSYRSKRWGYNQLKRYRYPVGSTLTAEDYAGRKTSLNIGNYAHHSLPHMVQRIRTDITELVYITLPSKHP